jgi:hypothetical protein
MAKPKDLPKGMEGLWRVQYEQRQQIFLNNASESSKKTYSKWKWSKKVNFIDDLQRSGWFN